MKSAILVVAVSLALSACQVNFGDRVVGNGNLTTQNRSVSGFTKLDVRGSFEVLLKPGNSFAVTVSADENLLPLIETTTFGNELSVRFKDGSNVSTTKDITIEITLPSLEAVQNRGSGSITGSGVFVSDETITTDVSGSGTIALALDCPTVESEITGSGTITLTGRCRKVDTHVTGSGEFMGRQLQAEEAVVKLTGSGDASVFASIALEATVTGSGDVQYTGGATQVRKTVTGSGTVSQK